MPAASRYAKAYVDACRARLSARLSAHAKLCAAASHSLAESEIHALEQGCLADMLIALDAMFAARLRGAEGKDGNPLNEMRLLSASLMTGDGALIADRTIKYDPAKAVLGLKLGEPIVLTAADVKKLGGAFLAEIERKYGE
jgi:hypothetical protein